MGTHTAQRPPAKVESEALDYMNYMCRIILGSTNRDRHFILNMDQTPVYFLMNAKRTLELIEKKTIQICTSTDDTERATMAVTIAVDGMLLPLMVVFKGQPKGKIARMEFSSFPTTNIYRCQANAWMDEAVMVCVFLASGYGWGTVMHEIPISSSPILMTSLPYPRTQ
jgi:hypothetical protein